MSAVMELFPEPELAPIYPLRRLKPKQYRKYVNLHHVLFERKMHEMGTTYKKNGHIEKKGWMHQVRDTKELIIPMDRDTHNALHEDIPFVVAPGARLAYKILQEFYPVKNDYIATTEALVGEIDELATHYQTSSIERATLQLMADGIGRQIPYLREGLILPRE